MATYEPLRAETSLDSTRLDNVLEEITEATPTAKRRPLVNLEGTDWLLTTLLLTLDAILLELYQREDTQYATFLTWFYRFQRKDGWEDHLCFILFVMFVAIVNVILLMPIINVNVRTPPRSQWRAWLLLAWLSLGFVNVLTVRQCVSSVQMYHDDDQGVESWVAHFWLLAVAALLTLVMDIRFVYLYGIFSCLTCDENPVLKTKQGLVQIYYQDSEEWNRFMEDSQRSMMESQSLLKVCKVPQLQRFNTVHFLEHISSGFSQFVHRRDMLSRLQNLRMNDARVGSDDLEREEYLREIRSVSLLHSWRARIAGKIKLAYSEIAEVENVFAYSSWIKAAAVFTVLMLIYSCIKTTELFFNLASSWDDYHRLTRQFQAGMDRVQTGLGTLDGRLVNITAQADYTEGTLTTVVNQTLPETLQDIQSLQQTLDVLDKTTGKAYDVAGFMLNMALLLTAKLINIVDLRHNPSVACFFYMDSIVPILKYTCMVGYPIGTLIGVHSLYQVLVQHKRLSLALEEALAARTHKLFGKGVVDNEEAKMTLLGIEERYQIGGAVYFFGTLMSTAVVQQHVFGFIITMNLAIIVDISNFDILLDIGGYLVFVYLAVMLMNLFLTHVVGDRLLTKDGFQIRHPWLFFLYLFSFSMVHAVLGFLYALWRAVLLLITTFLVINRLDISLLMTGKQFDNGHYSFMSMLLLTRVIRLTNIAQGYVQVPDDHDRESTDGSWRPSTSQGDVVRTTTSFAGLATSSSGEREAASQQLPTNDDGDENQTKPTGSGEMLHIGSSTGEHFRRHLM